MEKITVSETNERLDNYLSKYLEITRSQVKKNIDNIYVNGQNQKCGFILSAGDVITYEFKEDEEIKPENIKIDIVYEDDDIMVINKPNGLVVHPGAGNSSGTLVNALMYLSKNLSDINGEYRPGIVHRIDAYTTGLLVVAKNNEAHNILAEEIKTKTAKRKYYAIVWGTFNNTSGTIDAPIGRDPNNRLKMKVIDGGKEAITHFKVLGRYKNKYTLLQINLETGRTHQIRVHLSHIGYPIIGDEVYSNGKNEWNVSGQCLHAWKLEFKHPITGKEISLEAEIPEYLKKIIKELEEEN